jgi:imidazolonepropionase-like amidohydrolase
MAIYVLRNATLVDGTGTDPLLEVEEGQAYGGKQVAAHAIGYAGIKAAVQAGVHSIGHGYELDDELRQQMVTQGTFLVPTLLETMTPVTATPQGAAKSAK